MRLFPPRQVSGLLVLVAFVLNLGGVVMYLTGTTLDWVPATPTSHAWERALFMASYVAAALGAAVLAPAVSKAGAAILARLAATTFPMAATVALVMEALTWDGPTAPVLVVVTVLLLFGAGVLLGAALLASDLVPAWVGWTAVVWNVAWPVVLPIISPGDPYYPVLHAIPWLLAGVPLIRSGNKPTNYSASEQLPILNEHTRSTRIKRR